VQQLVQEKGELTFKPALSNKSMRLAERIYSELSTDDIDLPERLQVPLLGSGLRVEGPTSTLPPPPNPETLNSTP
jgi:hypothetical protein